MVWHGASGHHFSMVRWLELGFCGQRWLSPGPYYLSSRIRSAKETVVYSESLQNKPRTLWRLLQVQGSGWYRPVRMLCHSDNVPHSGIVSPDEIRRWTSSRMRVMNHTTKQRLHLQSVPEISHHSVLSGDRIRQCGTSSGCCHKDTDQCLIVVISFCRHRSVPVACENGSAETIVAEGGQNPVAGL